MLLCLWLLLAGAAQAGTVCSDKPLQLRELRQALQLAERSWQALEDSGAELALIARVGQDLSAYGLRYSHMGIVWRDHPDGRWTVVHALNACGTARSDLYNEGLGNFFLDDMFAWETLILIPAPADQARLAAYLAQARARQLHEARYNMLAFPFARDYQNSNQWVLETYASAVSPAPLDTRAAAQGWLRAAGFRPITVEIPALSRLGARLTRANISFDDQPFGQRMAGHIDTVSVESLVRFVRQRDAQARQIVLRLPAG
nr:DUF2145 domain-containing protein [Massilia sp. TS11]